MSSVVQTPALHNYDDAPRTPDPDDPALWLDPHGSGAGLLIVTLKEAGLQVYDTEGELLQTIRPTHRPPLGVDDPPSPGGPDSGTGACPDSTTGEDFSRFNNVDVHYGFPLRGHHHHTRRVDIAVVSDRGCDELRIYEIDPHRAGGPLFDITASSVPRLFPTRFEQPSPIQSPGEHPRVVANDLEEESTAYGLAMYQLGRHQPVSVIVTQAARSVLTEVELRDAGHGRVTYRRVREYRFNPTFRIRSHHRTILWSACREEVEEDPQFEGLVVDEAHGVLYAAQEVVGIWRVPLSRHLPSVVNVSSSALIEPTLTFGAPFWAVPDDDEFACESEAPSPIPAGTVVAAGNPYIGGDFLAADVEGLAIFDAGRGDGYLIASSQGDNTFHVYDRRRPTRHIGIFTVDGAGETDGHTVTNAPFGPLFPHGAFVLQSGDAPGPDSTDDINGYEYDGSARFEIVPWEDIASALGL